MSKTGQKLRTMTDHQVQVVTLSWHQHVLTSGCGDGSIGPNSEIQVYHGIAGLYRRGLWPQVGETMESFWCCEHMGWQGLMISGKV